MPEFTYKGRDKTGQLRTGQRTADTMDTLNNDLLKEGIFPTGITLYEKKPTLLAWLNDHLESKRLYLEELAIFARQMQQLQNVVSNSALAEQLMLACLFSLP